MEGFIAFLKRFNMTLKISNWEMLDFTAFIEWLRIIGYTP
jgi:hypothetical protein